MPVAYDSTSSYRPGARFGPSSIILASRFLETYDEILKVDLERLGIFTANEVWPDLKSPKRAIFEIERIAERFLKDRKFLLTLGGEHSITIGLVRAHQKVFTDLSVLYIDGHLDFRPSFQGTEYNHACVLYQIKKLGIPLVACGIRSMSKEEEILSRKLSLDFYSEKNIQEKGKKLAKEVKKGLNEKVYISIDLDVLNPSIMPEVGNPEPGGLSFQELISFLKEAIEGKDIVGFDVVELSPSSFQQPSSLLAAKLSIYLLSQIGISKDWFI